MLITSNYNSIAEAPFKGLLIVHAEGSGEEIIIYISSSQEIARQTVSLLKGKQVRNNNHYRDHDQPVSELVVKTADLFTNPKIAADYLGEVWQSHRRYARDQITQIARVCAKYSPQELEEALTYCWKDNPDCGISLHQVAQLQECLWLEQNFNLMMPGPSGTGKTFLAAGLCHEALRKGYRACFRTMDQLDYLLKSG